MKCILLTVAAFVVGLLLLPSAKAQILPPGLTIPGLNSLPYKCDDIPVNGGRASKIIRDLEGNVWVSYTKPDGGQTLGFISIHTGKFCTIAHGTTFPET